MKDMYKVLVIVALLTLLPIAAYGEDVYVGKGDVLTLKWTANPPEENVDHYDVYYCETIDGTYTKLTSVTGAQLTHVEMAEGGYWFKLMAIDTAGNSSDLNTPSPDRFIFDQTDPSIPGEISFTLTVEL